MNIDEFAKHLELASARCLLRKQQTEQRTKGMLWWKRKVDVVLDEEDVLIEGTVPPSLRECISYKISYELTKPLFSAYIYTSMQRDSMTKNTYMVICISVDGLPCLEWAASRVTMRIDDTVTKPQATFKCTRTKAEGDHEQWNGTVTLTFTSSEQLAQHVRSLEPGDTIIMAKLRQQDSVAA